MPPCPCGCSILVAQTDLGDTYQNADDYDNDGHEDPYDNCVRYYNPDQGDADGDGKLSYFEAHPEWYGLRNGKRSDKADVSPGDNYCTSNMDANKELAKNLVRNLIEGSWKTVDIVNFWMLDNGMRSGVTPKLVGWNTKADKLHRLIYLPTPIAPRQSTTSTAISAGNTPFFFMKAENLLEAGWEAPAE